MQDAIDQILREVSSLAEPLLGAVSQPMVRPTVVRQSHDAVLAYLDQFEDSKLVDAVLEAASAQQLHHRLVQANAHFHSVVEKEKARSFLASDRSDPFEGSWINKGFTDLLRGQLDQWARCGVDYRRPGFSIAVVGGGALPQTQVFLHEALACRVVGIDRDPEATELCANVLRRIGMGHLGAETADGSLYDYSEFDMVIVATLVGDKASIGLKVASDVNAVAFCPRVPVRMHRMWRESIELDKLRSAMDLLDAFTPQGSSVGSLLLRPRREGCM